MSCKGVWGWYAYSQHGIPSWSEAKKKAVGYEELTFSFLLRDNEKRSRIVTSSEESGVKERTKGQRYICLKLQYGKDCSGLKIRRV